MENYGLFALLLVILGIGVLFSEIFIPSAGMLSFVALACFGGSAFCAYHGWYVPGKLVLWWSYIIGVVVVVPSGIAGVMYYLPRTKMGQELFATPPTLAELTPFAKEEQRLISLIEDFGTAMTLFSPGGMAQIGREKFHAESEGIMIEPGTEIVVVGVRGNRLLVRPLSLHPERVETADADGDSSLANRDHENELDPLDETLSNEATKRISPTPKPTVPNNGVTFASEKDAPKSGSIDFDIPESV